MNRWVGIGRITKDLELKKTNNGKSFLNFSLAVNRDFKNKVGEYEADFINCQVWDKQAESMATYVGKGSLIGVEGRIQTRSYDNNEGKRVYVTEIVCDRIEFLDSKRDNQPKQKNQNDVIMEVIKEQQVGENVNDELPF